MNIGADGKPVLASKPTEHKCEKCGKPMMLKEWKGRYFLGCTRLSASARTSMDADAEGNPVKPVDTGVNCEKCGSPMARQARLPRAVPLVQRLPEVPQRQADPRRIEGETQGRPAAGARKKEDAGHHRRYALPGLRRQNEAVQRPRPLLPRLLDLGENQVQRLDAGRSGNSRAIAESESAGTGGGNMNADSKEF